MTIDVLCVKMANGTLGAVGHEAEEFLKSLKAGQQLWVSVRKARNPKFHRKFMAMMNYAFDLWAEAMPYTEWNGMPVKADFETFRKNVICSAGFCDAHFSGDGQSFQLVPRSIKFEKMDDEEFERLYDAVITVLVEKFIPGLGWSSTKLKSAIEDILSYA